MARALAALLAQKKVAVIGGGSYEQFKNQFVRHFTCPPALFENLFLFPTTSTSFYRYRRRGWKKVYRKVLKAAEKKKIMRAFADAFAAIGLCLLQKNVWGKVIEDRGSQITFSALGQEASQLDQERGDKRKME